MITNEHIKTTNLSIDYETETYQYSRYTRKYEWLKYENFGGVFINLVFDTKLEEYINNNNLLCVYKLVGFDQDNDIVNAEKCFTIQNAKINGQGAEIKLHGNQDPQIDYYKLYSGIFTFNNLLNATKQLKIEYQLKLYSSDFNNYFSVLSVTDKVQFGNESNFDSFYNFKYRFYSVKYGNII